MSKKIKENTRGSISIVIFFLYICKTKQDIWQSSDTKLSLKL
nr:MAG TPA: hypothetical protein [Caudoviricetes sp.]